MLMGNTRLCHPKLNQSRMLTLMKNTREREIGLDTFWPLGSGFWATALYDGGSPHHQIWHIVAYMLAWSSVRVTEYTTSMVLS